MAEEEQAQTPEHLPLIIFVLLFTPYISPVVTRSVTAAVGGLMLSSRPRVKMEMGGSRHGPAPGGVQLQEPSWLRSDEAWPGEFAIGLARAFVSGMPLTSACGLRACTWRVIRVHRRGIRRP